MKKRGKTKKRGDENQDKKNGEMRCETKKIRRRDKGQKKNGEMRCEMKKKWRDKI